MRSLPRLALIVLLGIHVLVHGLACTDDDRDGGSAAGNSGLAGSTGAPVNLDGVLYEGGVTDEAVASMLGVAAAADDSKTPRALSVDGLELAGAPPFAFRWSTSTAQLAPAPLDLAPERELLPGFGLEPRSAHDVALAPRPAPGRRWPAWLGPERCAHAHGAPFTGVAYLLTFRVASDPAVLRLATSKTEYTPMAQDWEKLRAAGAPITVGLTVARLEQNLLAAGGGPFVSTEGVTFTIK